MESLTGSTRRWATAADFPQPKGKGPNGRPFCRWCHREVGKGLRKWCGMDCVNQYWVRASGQEVRRQVLKRDGGVCAICGLEAQKLSSIMRHARHYFRGTSYFRPLGAMALLRPIGDFRAFGESYWQPDHIVPVCEGGGMCGLDNYRTLCTPCHAVETAKLAGRRANPSDARQKELF